MCGITGYWSHTINPESFQNALPEAVARLHHRGPDDQGVWYNNRKDVGFGHTRLAILDLTPLGHQPMVSQDGRVVMVFNGEIYNFKEIQKVLTDKGYKFRGSGDADVALAAYCEWGIKAVDRFIGMFAMAFWEPIPGRLRLLRDRLGVKPLYYGWKEGVLWFGSELKALRAFPHWQPEINTTALGEFFQYGYINAPRTIYKNIHKLEPGHWLELTSGKEPKTWRYWSVTEAMKTPLVGNEEALTDQLEELLVDAFSLRMISDVPVGVFLSGGIDSSLVAALLQKKNNQPIHTFTIGFSEKKFDESHWAKKIASHLGTHHTEQTLDLSQAMEILPRWGEMYDEPFGDSSGLPTFLVSQMARDQVKVVLSADGGDELFGGYEIYENVPKTFARWKRLPESLRQSIHLGLKFTPRQLMRQLLGALPVFPAKDSIVHLLDRLDPAEVIFRNMTPSTLSDLSHSNWLEPEVTRLIGNYESPCSSMDIYDGQFVERMMLWDLHNYLPGDILTKVDRSTMAVSLEGRDPLLDHRVAEFAFRLPLNLRCGALGGKHLLRKVLYRHVPPSLIDRPKQGFAIPIASWFRQDLSPMMDNYLNPGRIKDAGILDPDRVARTVRHFRRGAQGDARRLWMLIAFEMWREQWFK